MPCPYGDHHPGMNVFLEQTARLVIVAGDDPATVLDRALTHHQWFDGATATLALATRSQLELPAGPGRLVSRALKQRGFSCSLIAPPDTAVGSWFRASKTEWKAVELTALAGRLERVWLPASIVDASTLVAVNNIRSLSEARDPISIGIWSKFAHPRQRAGAWLSNDRDGLTAEIASAVRPALILLFAKWRSFTVIVASDDQVATELAGRSIQQLSGELLDVSTAPWENPLVQHASELGVGIQRPSQIVSKVIWAGSQGGSAASAFTGFATDVLARIGVKSTGSVDSAAYT